MIQLVLLAVLAAAEPPPASTLTLDEALKQAVAHQPILNSARFQREAAAAALTQATSIEYPQVHADAEVFGASDNATPTAYLTPPDFVRIGSRMGSPQTQNDFTPYVSSLAGVGAHYDVLDFGYTRGTVGAARAQLEAAKRTEGQTLQDVLLRVTTTYFGALAAQETLLLAQDTLKRAQEHDAYAAAGVKSGLKPPVDLPRSRAEVEAARLAVIRAQNNLAVSRAALDTAIGWTPADAYILTKPPEDHATVPAPDTAVDQAMSNRPDLAALRAQEQAAEMQQMVARSGNYPRLTATSALSLRGFAGAPDTSDYDVGLVLSLPIFTGFAVKGEIDQADASLSDLKAREAALRDAIRYQLRQSRETLLSARQAISASQAQVEAAKASLDLAEGRYKQGLGNLVELTDAEAQYDTAGLGLVESELDASIARAQLDYALGELRAP